MPAAPSRAQTKPLLRRAGDVLRRLVGTRALLLLNAYVPYVGAGVRIRRVAPDASWFDVELPLRPWNKNYFGTHFGGSLYAMCDPFYALILTELLGPGYVVWDKEASIGFKRPGRGTVRARFEVSHSDLEDIRGRADRDGKTLATFQTEVTGPDGEVVAQVHKTLSIRRTAGAVSSG
jgi:acyl-coenzyme A thioesterase PaaI-like protein